MTIDRDKTRERVCIVGAGPAGLSAARALQRLDIPYDHFERHCDVGGIWDLENPGTPMYKSAHFISSRKMSGFFDFPMPDTFPDYPSHREILEYTRDFAAAYRLREAVQFNCAVAKVEHKDDDLWEVTLDDGTRRLYRAVICATGVTWAPRVPEHPGAMGGEVRHSSTYRDPSEFRGKRVLIVGLGNSGADIACDAAANAEAAFVSVRRGYHVIPKHLFGIPADEFGSRGAGLPIQLRRRLMTLVLRLAQGDLTRYFPKPDHRLFESHPLLNSQLLHHLQHGDIAVRPDVARLDGDHVVFVDGSTEKIDLVLYATGYDWDIAYVPADYFHWNDGRPDLYLSAFNRHHHNLFGLGYLEINSSAFTVFDQVSNIVAQYLNDQTHNPDRAAAFDQMIAEDHPRLHGGIQFLDSARHRSYVDAHAYRDYLSHVREQIGWQDLASGMFTHQPPAEHRTMMAGVTPTSNEGPTWPTQ